MVTGQERTAVGLTDPFVAYNAGAGRVKFKLNGKRTRTFDAIASKLPSETQMFVPELNGGLLLREGMTLEKLGKPA